MQSQQGDENSVKRIRQCPSRNFRIDVQAVKRQQLNESFYALGTVSGRRKLVNSAAVCVSTRITFDMRF